MRIILLDASFEMENLDNFLLLQNLACDAAEASIAYYFAEFNEILKFRDMQFAIEIYENQLIFVTPAAFEYLAKINPEMLKKMFNLSCYLYYTELSECILYYFAWLSPR